jgi:prepilin-type N-terminal cleavage/methylation domain-containing protein
VVLNNHKHAGFTLLELIGVMAVMAILAGALAPAVIQLLDEGYQTAEEQNLRTIGDALQRYIRQTKAIPRALDTEWPVAVANYAALPAPRVLTNDKNFNRRLYFDPRFFSTVDQVFPGFAQDRGLASTPNSPRAMIVSNLQGAVTTALNTNAQFQAVWDQTNTATIVETKNLMIERLNFAPLFIRAVLSNSSASQGGYALESGTEGAVAAAGGGLDGVRTIFVVADTRLSLNAAPFPGGATLRELVVTDEISLRYQLVGGNWFWVD